MSTTRHFVRAAVAVLATLAVLGAQRAAADPAGLRQLAHDCYQWRDAQLPVQTSQLADHRYDDRLTDYSPAEVNARQTHVSELLAKLNAMPTDGWSRDDRVDAILFQAQLEGLKFFAHTLEPTSTDPQLYVNECSNAIFTLLQKDYAPHRTRA